MGQEVWGFNEPDARALKALAGKQQSRPMPGLEIEWPGAMMPSVRTYIVIPNVDSGGVNPPTITGGEVILDSGSFIILRRATSPGEGSTDQVIFHTGLIDSVRSEITCFNLTRTKIPQATVPADPNEPNELSTLYYAIQDNFGDFYIVKSISAHWAAYEASGGDLTLTGALQTIVFTEDDQRGEEFTVAGGVITVVNEIDVEMNFTVTIKMDSNATVRNDFEAILTKTGGAAMRAVYGSFDSDASAGDLESRSASWPEKFAAGDTIQVRTRQTAGSDVLKTSGVDCSLTVKPE